MMTISNILVPITGAPQDAVALQTAIAAARPFRAHVRALFVSPDERGPVAVSDWQSSPGAMQKVADAHAHLRNQLKEAARETFAACALDAHAKVGTLAQRSDGVTVSWSEQTGQLSRVIASNAQFSDLVVFPPPAGTQDSGMHEAFLHTLLRAGRSVLLSPQAAPEHVGTHAAVGWNDGLAAANALVAAMPFLEMSGNVRLLLVRRHSSAEPELTEVKEYLALHGVKATEQVIAPGAQSIGEALLDGAVGCDLIVIGGYGHSHALENIFGGVTEQITSHPRIPILLVH